MGDIIVTEIMQNPDAVEDSDGEWFELYNASDRPFSLEGAVISDGGGSSHTIAEELVILAGEYVVLGNNGDIETNGGVYVDYVYTDFPLANNNDDIILTVDGVEIDRVEYDDELGWPDPVGASMQLSVLFLDSLSNDDGANWCASSDEIVIDGDLGTPRMQNDICADTELLVEDFESDPGWTVCAGGSSPCDWEWGTPTAGPDACAGGTGCYGTTMDGDYSNDAEWNNNFVEYGPVDLNDVTSAYLAFDMWLSIEERFDNARIEISTDGSMFEVLTPASPEYDDAEDGWSSDFFDWTSVEAELTPYIGGQIYIRWAVNSDGSITNPGLYIDNVFVFSM